MMKVIDGNLALVALDCIVTETADFKNPRRASSAVQPKGYAPEEMEELRNAIKNEGLEHPLSIRAWAGKKKYVVLNGERRFRCLQKLIADKEMCYDPATKQNRPADQLYKSVCCRVHSDITDDVAYQLAFSTNDRACDIGETATVAVVRHFYQDLKWSEAQILKVTGKSKPWLAETIAIIKLDQTTWDSFAAGRINRSVAAALAQKTERERVASLEAVIEVQKHRVENMRAVLQQGVTNLSERWAIAKADATVQSKIATTTAEKNKAAQLANSAKAIEQTLAKKKSELQSVTTRPASMKDFAAAEKQVNDIANELTFNKIQKCHIAKLSAIINPTPEQAVLIAFMRHWWQNGVLKGEQDFGKILRSFRAV